MSAVKQKDPKPPRFAWSSRMPDNSSRLRTGNNVSNPVHERWGCGKSDVEGHDALWFCVTGLENRTNNKRLEDLSARYVACRCAMEPICDTRWSRVLARQPADVVPPVANIDWRGLEHLSQRPSMVRVRRCDS